MVFGDTPDAILRMSERDPLPWLVGFAGRRDVDYLLSKIVASYGAKEFYVGDAWHYLDREIADDSMAAVTVADELEEYDYDITSEQWAGAWMDAGADEVPGMSNWSTDALWIAECIFWFANAMKAKQTAAEARP